jgi:hypothetical protein
VHDSCLFGLRAVQSHSCRTPASRVAMSLDGLPGGEKIFILLRVVEIKKKQQLW